MIKPSEDKIHAFFDWLFDGIFEGGGFDGGDIQDKAEELGLLILCKVDRTDDAYKDKCDEYDSDELYFPWWTDEAQKVLSNKPSERQDGK